MHLTPCVRAAVAGHSRTTATPVELVRLILLLSCWCTSGADAPEMKWCKMNQIRKLRTFELTESYLLTFIEW